MYGYRLGFNSNFSDKTPKVKPMKERSDKPDLIKVFFSVKDTTSKTEKKMSHWMGKIFIEVLYNKAILFDIYKEFLKLNNKT